MKLLAQHIVLTSGTNKEECRTQVLHFFEQTSLVRYDRISIDDTSIISGSHQDFSTRLAKGLQRNEEVLAKLIEELKGAGFENRKDLRSLPQGYPSKVLHIIAHFLDGFIGIDTAFYNLIDDSHWIPEGTSERMTDAPEQFWLFSLDCYSMTPREAAVLHM
jgi:hypothetical protein